MLSFKDLLEMNQLQDVSDKNIWISLQEGFNISTTEFGTNFPDFNNHRIANGRTYFNYKTRVIEVNINKIPGTHIVYFKFASGNKVNDEKDLDPITGNLKLQDSSALSIYNRVIYVLFEYLENNRDINEVQFQGADKDLQKIYSVMIKNTKFLKTFEKYGWKYMGFENDNYKFVYDNEE